jgi:hypothetical protein
VNVDAKLRKENLMQKNMAPYGSDVSSGLLRCADCGQEIEIGSQDSTPPCPRFNDMPHPKKAWEIVEGVGDAEEDPYPDQK